MDRYEDIERFYQLLAELEEMVGGKQQLKDCTGFMDWPDRGVYFFFASDEYREDSSQRRVTRVGTHAISEGSGTTLWNRLRTHRGTTSGSYEGGGNHRGSVFRERIGEAIIERDALHNEYQYWSEGSSAKRDRRLDELELERRVSTYLRELPFLWVNIDDEPSAQSQRAYIEQNTIALLSNYHRDPIDPRRDDWLGIHSQSRKIQQSGLWNINHVDEQYDPAFLNHLADAIKHTQPP